MKTYKNKDGAVIDLELVKNQYFSHVKIKDIASNFGCSWQQIGKIVWLEIPKRRKHIPKYSIDENFFDAVDTEEKAYILGFLMADGYVNGKQQISIGLQNGDVEILKYMKEKLKSESPIKINTLDGRKYCCISFYSKTLCQQLMKIGCVKNKTEKLTWIDNRIKPELMNHFIRGFFDGDGHFSYYFCKKTLKTHFSVTATQKFCKGLSKFFKYKFGYMPYMSQRHKGSSSNNRTIELSGNRQNIAVMDWLYSNSTIFLKRKYDKYMKFRSTYLNKGVSNV
jgi:hypothetical protein